jgi:hypothetical protein
VLAKTELLTVPYIFCRGSRSELGNLRVTRWCLESAVKTKATGSGVVFVDRMLATRSSSVSWGEESYNIKI